MNLCIDIGNTNAHIGIFKDNQLIYSKKVDIRYLGVSNIFDFNYDIKKIGAASVKHVMTNSALDILNKKFNIKPQLIDKNFDAGFEIEYDNNQIGIDRLLAVFAAKRILKQENIIVIDFGTAITIDILENNIFIGGVIFPGINLLFNSLKKEIPALKIEKFEQPTCDIGINTASAVNAGLFFNIIGWVEFYLRRYKKDSNTKLALTGGACHVFEKFFEHDYSDNALVLHGINFCL